MIGHDYHNRRIILSFAVLLLQLFSGCNQIEQKPITQEYKELHALFINAPTSEKQLAHGTIFLEKAKREKDTAMIIAGYRMLSITHTDENILSYSDSIIALKINTSDKNYPAIAYEKKGDFYYDKRVYQNAIDNYLQFFAYAKKHDQKEMISRANYNIGVVKRRMGNIQEALLLYRKNYAFTKRNKEVVSATTYLNSITAIANVFNDLEISDSAVYYNNLGYNEAIRLQNERFQKHFAINQGIAKYHNDEFEVAIDSIEKHIPYFEKLNDDDKLSFAYYYNGEAYWKRNNKNAAIAYFKKVDSTFQKTQSLFPLIREAYMRLDTYYNDQNDFENQLYYKNQLIKVNRIIKADELYANKAIFKQYEIPKLQAEKETISTEKQLQKNTFKKIISILLLLVLLLILTIGFQYKKRTNDKRKFLEAIHTKRKSKITEKQGENPSGLSIPIEIVQEILLKLEAFEHKNEFVSNQITLNYLAKELKTNPNYLSKVVNHHKKCSFSNYINNLRIEFTIEQLKTNPTYLKYTIKAIASEVGFNNVQSFSKAFFNSKGINPSYFIRQLKKVKAS